MKCPRIDDTLIILDEPETHFNDVWKREVTDIIDQSLQNSSSEVVLATHSSIALSDAFDTEITVLHKNTRTGNITARRPAIRSFGASPNEILRDVFDAPETVGQRASEFLNLMLIVAAHPAQARAIWMMDGNDDEIYRSTAFRRLSRVIVARMNEDGEINTSPDSWKHFDQHLLHTLRSVRDYTEQCTGKREVDVADVLDVLQNRLGPGYYQFEFRRRLNALLERREPNAP